MRTVIIAFTHEGMKVAKKASTVTDEEVTIYCHKRCGLSLIHISEPTRPY